MPEVGPNSLCQYCTIASLIFEMLWPELTSIIGSSGRDIFLYPFAPAGGAGVAPLWSALGSFRLWRRCFIAMLVIIPRVLDYSSRLIPALEIMGPLRTPLAQVKKSSMNAFGYYTSS